LRRVAGLLFTAALLCRGLSAPEQAALDRISADSMRGNLSFLASDALEGRATPSRGLSIAAEFIASCFRRAGLQELSPGYLQTADFVSVTPRLDDFRLTVGSGGQELDLTSVDADVRALAALDLKNVEAIELPSSASLAGRIVAGDARVYGTDPALDKLRAARPALILLISRPGQEHEPGGFWQDDAEDAAIPVIRIFNGDAADTLAGKRAMTVSAQRCESAERGRAAAGVGSFAEGPIHRSVRSLRPPGHQRRPHLQRRERRWQRRGVGDRDRERAGLA
jgi:hypothetical protein